MHNYRHMPKYYGWGLPIDISTNGWQIDRLIWVIHWFMAALFVGWFCFFIFVIIRFRQRAGLRPFRAVGPEGHKAASRVKHFKLPTYVEVGVAIFEALLLMAFSFPIWQQAKVDFPPEDKSLHVRVMAEQFAWNIHYPGVDGVFGKADPKLMSPSNPLGLDPSDPAGKDDIATINQLHIPVNTPVIAELSSKDVIHSFTLPVMRVKQDIIPGQRSRIWFEAKDTGEFEIACAQLCGLGHYRMRGFFTVDTKEKFADWLKEQAPKP